MAGGRGRKRSAKAAPLGGSGAAPAAPAAPQAGARASRAAWYSACERATVEAMKLCRQRLLACHPGVSEDDVEIRVVTEDVLVRGLVDDTEDKPSLHRRPLLIAAPHLGLLRSPQPRPGGGQAASTRIAAMPVVFCGDGFRVKCNMSTLVQRIPDIYRQLLSDLEYDATAPDDRHRQCVVCLEAMDPRARKLFSWACSHCSVCEACTPMMAAGHMRCPVCNAEPNLSRDQWVGAVLARNGSWKPAETPAAPTELDALLVDSRDLVTAVARAPPQQLICTAEEVLSWYAETKRRGVVKIHRAADTGGPDAAWRILSQHIAARAESLAGGAGTAGAGLAAKMSSTGGYPLMLLVDYGRAAEAGYPGCLMVDEGLFDAGFVVRTLELARAAL